MILVFFAGRGVVYASGGYPIMGATVNVWDGKRCVAAAATDPMGRFDFRDQFGTGHTLEVINGSETVTIRGDEVRVVTPEMARERWRKEVEWTPTGAEKLVRKPWYRRLRIKD